MRHSHDRAEPVPRRASVFNQLGCAQRKARSGMRPNVRAASLCWGYPLDIIRINDRLMTAQNSHIRVTAYRDRREI